MHRDPQSRRRLLGTIGTALAVGVAGCTDNSSQPTYERRSVDVPADAEPRSATEATAAAQQATTETSNTVAPIDAVELTGHEYVFESGYLGSTVQGTVENSAGGPLDTVELRVRVYNDADQLLGQYLDRAEALDSGETWAFTAILLESPSDIAAYEIAALGTPF